jgi:16S rRNA (uracil1498-N3)-methyltransferase
MTRRRWIADEVSGNRAALVGDHARHLIQVLRAKIGQEFDISTGAEVRGGIISSIQRDRVEFDLVEKIENSPQVQSAEPRITVAMSIFKFDRMEWAIEKCTELGVAKVVPVIAGRTEPNLAVAAGKRVERWRRIVQQAAEQSRRISPPDISDPVKLTDLFALTADARIVLHESEKGLPLIGAVAPVETVILAFGPEGGWKEQETAAFREAGWVPASLGPNILRAETAIIAAVVIIISSFN